MASVNVTLCVERINFIGTRCSRLFKFSIAIFRQPITPKDIKLQIPSVQAPEKLQAPTSKTDRKVLEFEVWSLSGAWMPGAWSFFSLLPGVAGIKPLTAKSWGIQETSRYVRDLYYKCEEDSLKDFEKNLRIASGVGSRRTKRFCMASRLDHVHDWNKLASRAHFRVAALAKDCGVSERQLRRYFRKQFGKSPRKWMTITRLGNIRPLLTSGKSVKEIATQAGFNHQSNFARSFKQYYHATPSSQRRTI